MRAACSSVATIVNSPAATVSAVAGKGDIGQYRTALSVLTVVVKCAAVMSAIAGEYDIGQFRIALAAFTMIEHRTAVQARLVAAEDKVAEPGRTLAGAAVTIDASAMTVAVIAVCMTAGNGESVEHCSVRQSFSGNDMIAVLTVVTAFTQVAAERRFVVAIVPLLALYLHTGKAAVDFHAIFQGEAGCAVGSGGWLVCAFCHPDFVAGLRIIQRLLQVGVSIIPPVAVIVTLRCRIDKNDAPFISAHVDFVVADARLTVRIGRDAAKGARIPGANGGRTDSQAQVAGACWRGIRIDRSDKSWIVAEVGTIIRYAAVPLFVKACSVNAAFYNAV